MLYKVSSSLMIQKGPTRFYKPHRPHTSLLQMNPSLCDGSCNAKVKIPSSIVVDEEEEPVDNQPQGGFYEEEHLWWFQVSRNLTWKEGNLSFERLKDIYSVYMYTIYQWLIVFRQVLHLSIVTMVLCNRQAGCKTYKACNGRWLFKVICGLLKDCGRIPLIMNNLMVVVGFLKTHTVNTLPKKNTKCQEAVKTKSTYQNSAGLPGCRRPNPAK